MDQNNGGIIGKINTPTTTVASGVWSLDSQFESQSGSTWPLAFPQTTIANSLRFDGGSTDNLSRTFTAGNRKTFTISVWVKRANISTEFQAVNVAHTGDQGIFFAGGDQLDLFFLSGRRKTNAVYRDMSAWYHIVVAVDSTNSTAGDRIKLYVNGVQETSFGTSTDPSLNAEGLYNDNGNINNIGKHSSQDYDFYGYQAEHIFVDGQALTPTSFGVFNTVSNIWEPRPYTGTYGTNGFRLDFADSSALGNDVSGNDNDFTVNNLTSIDQSTDTCSNNFATLNPLRKSTNITYSDGNLKQVCSLTNNDSTMSTMAVNKGKWYFEAKMTSLGSGNQIFGVREYNGTSLKLNEDGTYSSGLTPGSTAPSGFSQGDILSVALDLDSATKTIQFYTNGSANGDPMTLSGWDGVSFLASQGGNDVHTMEWNFGSPAFSISSGNSDANGFGNFEYAVPSGYYALCTKNLAEFG